MTNVAVVGATGYAGVELVRILAGHPNVKLSCVTSRNYAGSDLASIYPALGNVIDLKCERFDPERIGQKAEVVFTALPHKLPMEIVPELLNRGCRVVDLSADFRFQDATRYEAHYQPHTARELLSRSVYGLSEIYRSDIAAADLIGNPGCYPTSVLLPLVPLVRNQLVDTGSLIADAKSGVSGAGRSPALATLYCEVTESFKAYKVTEHRHNPEMEEVLSREAGSPVHLTFVPHLVPMSRGMLTTVYATLRDGASAADIGRCLEDAYDGCAFIRLRGQGVLPETRHVRGTNYCDIGFRIDKAARRLVLIAAIDNLVKGAAGQAVQNMNLMCGFEETAGLSAVPYPL